MPDADGESSRLRIVLMGTGPFAVPSFEALRQAGHDCLAVVTRPDVHGPGGKRPPKSPVRLWAESHGLSMFAPDSINSEESRAYLAELQADLFVVCDYGQILKKNILSLARLGGINLHGSLLPAFRGAAPVQRALLSGIPETGVSVIHMSPRLDAGPVICSRTTDIQARETSGELESRLAQIGIEATLEAVDQLVAELPRLERGEDLPPLGITQTDAQASKAPRLHKSEGRIDWTRSMREIDLHVRGMQPWPNAFSEVPTTNSKKPPLRLVILEVEHLDTQQGDDPPVPGSVSTEGGRLVVRCGDGFLHVQRLKPAGKREMTDEEWLRGRPIENGAILG